MCRYTSSFFGKDDKSLGGLDLLGCIDRVVQMYKQERRPTDNLNLKDVFTSLKFAAVGNNRGGGGPSSSGCGTHGKLANKINNTTSAMLLSSSDDIIEQITKFQTVIQEKYANFSYNVFEQQTKTSVKALAEKIMNEIPFLQQYQLPPATHVNTWKGTIVKETTEY